MQIGLGQQHWFKLYQINNMNFKSHRKQKSILVASHRENQQRNSPHLQSSHPLPPDLLQRAKHLYYSQKNLMQAVQLFNQYLEINPQNSQALYLCGVTCLHVNRIQQSIDRLLRVSQEYSNHSNAILLAAMAYKKLENPLKSLDLIDKCIYMYPFFEEGICFRGRLHLDLKNYDKAQLDFKCAVGFKKGSFLSLMGLADCFKATNRSQKALLYYKRAKQALIQLKNNKYSQQIYDIQLKIGVCFYSMQKYEESLAQLSALSQKTVMKTSDLYYYMGVCQLKLSCEEKGMLYLEYSMRLQTNGNITKKAYKKLLVTYLKNYQFYQALNIVKLGDKCGIELPEWKDTIESFMQIIKGEHQTGAATLKKIRQKVKNNQIQKRVKHKKGSFKQLRSIKQPLKIKLLDRSKKMSFFEASKDKEKDSLILMNNNRSMRKRSELFSKSVQKAINKIGSVNNYKQVIKAPRELLRYKTEHIASEILNSPHLSQDSLQTIFNEKQKQVIYPLILKFKAYAEFFSNNFMASLQTYEEYENYLKDMFGRQSDLNYNRLVCQAMLMSQTDMADDALSKLSQCVEYFFQKYGRLSAQPILYKTILLLRLAATKQDTDTESQDQEIASFEQILDSTLKMLQNYREGIKNLPLAHFLQALIYIMLDRLQKARDCLQKTLKLTDECNWKYLYVKGVVQMMLGNYYDAVKQLSAGLILQNRAEFYLCRSICFYILSQGSENGYDEQSVASLMKSVNISAQLSGSKKSQQPSERICSQKDDIFLQYCFEDLQNFIEQQTDKNKISVWVSKLLFVSKSFEEAISSLQKIPIDNVEMLQLAKCIEIYQGQFQDGGSVGTIIKSAFDGSFLTPEQQHKIFLQGTVKNYNNAGFGFLSSSYQKWLVILDIYVNMNYPTLLKYIQKELFSVKDQQTQVLLRYNLCIIYLLNGQITKTINVAKSLLKFDKKYHLQKVIQKLIHSDYEEDQCLGEITRAAGIGSNKLLSNYLPFQPVSINANNKTVRIYARINVPFPQFPRPNLSINIEKTFILEQITSQMIEKKIEAPWIHKINNEVIQFTEKLDESECGMEQMSSRHHSSCVQRVESESILNCV